MNLQECKTQLQEYISKNSDISIEDIRFHLKEIWGNPKDAALCYKSLGGNNGIGKIINNTKSSGSEKVHGAATENNEYVEVENDVNNQNSEIETTKTQSTTSVQKEDDFGIGAIVSEGFGYAKMGLYIIVLFILILVFWKLIRFTLAFLYDVFNAKRLIFLKVTLPRGDSKFDREREKEIAKDMKEKISRMAQVFRNLHKLGELSVMDNIMKWIFNKPKVSMMLNYNNGNLSFIVSTYPEYKKIIEGAISAQYSESSLEETNRPKFFAKKYSEIIPLQPVKDTVYPIRTFKQLEDDPLNNIVDSIGKISNEDAFTVLISVKPQPDSFNKRAQSYADALYKKDQDAVVKMPLWKKILMPWKIIDFLVYGPDQKFIKRFSSNANQGDPIVRMVKAEEEALNVMGEEAGKHAFGSSLLLISSSDDKVRINDNIRNVVSAYTIYKDEYNNELDQPEFLADLFGFILKPLWRFAATFHLVSFFFKKNIFTVNELASLFHFPDGLFNRSPIIRWMDYKVLAAPDNVPVLKEESGYFMSGVIAEEFKKGNLSEILAGKKHRSIGEKTEDKKINFTVDPNSIIEDNGISYVKILNEVTPKVGIGETFLGFKNYNEKVKTINNEKYLLIDSNEDIFQIEGKYFVEMAYSIKKYALKIFKDGVLLGINVYRNTFTPIYMKRKDRSRHHYIIGKSGGGKSVFISALARQDVWNGDGLCVIDPHGDLVEDILNYIPKERARDVIYFDAGNEDRPMGLNLYEIDTIDHADRVVNDATEIFLKMFGSEIFGPRIQEYFKYGSLTLLEDLEDGATLIDVPRLFTDEVFREYKIKKVKNPVVRNFWERTYNAMGDREKQEIIPYFTSKFVSFITNRLIRNIIGQTKSGFKFRTAMDEGKILLVNLSKGKIGELNAQLLGMVLVSQIYNAAMSRADVPEDQRRDFYLYVDEFQNFVTGTFADILSEARKYHLGLIMAHQYVAQLEDKKAEGGKADVKKAVFGNVGTMQSFKIGAEDAEFFEKEYAPVLSAQDIIGISNYKVYTKLNINNATSRVFSMDTLWTEDYKNPKVAEVIKEYSAKKYGRKREFVEAEITARLGMLEDEGEESLDNVTETPIDNS